jgi:hypothetical protein
MNGLSESTSLMIPTVKVSLPAGCSWAVTPGAAVSASSAASTPITTALRAGLPGFRPCPPCSAGCAHARPPCGNPTTADIC